MLFWLWELLSTQSVAHTVLVLSLVAALGLTLGSVQVGGISLGIGGVLFAGIAFGYLGFTIDPHTLHFVRECGLTLFVFTMRMQVGPGFFSSLRQQGFKKDGQKGERRKSPWYLREARSRKCDQKINDTGQTARHKGE